MPPGADAAGTAIVVDYDGTIALADVSDQVVRRSASHDAWLAIETAYRRGEFGSRTLLEREVRLLPPDPAALRALAGEPAVDPAFRPFVERARSLGAIVEVVSDGLGFFVADAMARLGLAEVPVYTARLEVEGDALSIRFPHGHPTCRECGTCKRQRVLAHQAAGRHVAFVGDGYSDQYAVAYADTVFAKDDLARLCAERDVPFVPWSSFADVGRWLEAELEQGGPPAPRARRFVCGPEAPVRG